jgi:hypothetical protein
MSASFNTDVPCFILVLWAGLFSACASGGSEAAAAPSAEDASGGESAEGNVSLPGGRPVLECEVDSDCIPQRLAPLDISVQLVSAECTHLYEAHPVCACEIDGIFREPTTGQSNTVAGQLVPGNRVGGCSEFGRTPGSCVYCESEFPGCDIADAGSCDAVCADVLERMRVEWARTLPVTTRLARCIKEPNYFRCDTVFELGGMCYAGPLSFELPPLDCSLSDEELATHRFDSSQYPTCAPRAQVACSRSEECPRGLACNLSVAPGRCEPCPQVCVGCGFTDGCATGEVCVEDTCVLEANATCRSFTECPEEHSCKISSISSIGRGNESSRSVCEPYSGLPSR